MTRRDKQRPGFVSPMGINYRWVCDVRRKDVHVASDVRIVDAPSAVMVALTGLFVEVHMEHLSKA